MLMKPPPLAEQMDNLSHLNTESDVRQSSRSKNKNRKKQNSLSLRSKPLGTRRENEEKQREGDNGSVHSYASGKSKRSRKKQSSIGVQRSKGALIKANSPMKSEEDDIEVLDYEGIDNHKHNLNPVQYSEVKNDYVPVTPQNYHISSFQNRSPNINNNKYSFKNIIRNDYQTYQQKNGSNKSIDDQIPVVKLVQNRYKEPVYENRPSTNTMVSPKIAERTQTRKLGQLFEQNRRNLQNQSSFGGSGIPSQINNSSVIGNQSRRSRSKLGQLFKQKSKQKQMNNNSSNLTYTQNASSNFQGSASDLKLKVQSQVQNSRNRQVHALGGRSKEKQTIKKNNIPQKVLQESVHQFDGGDDFNKDDLNLSLSRNSPFVSKIGSHINNNKDSVCFNLEPEKQKRKKGLGVASKLIQESDEMIKISGNLQSKDIYQLRAQGSQDQFVNVNGNMVSKQIDAHQKLRSNLRQNQKYLIESGAFNYSNRTDNQHAQTEAKKIEQIRRKQQVVRAKQRQLQRAAISEKNKQEQFRMQQQRQLQRRKQEELRLREQSFRKEEEKRRDELKRKQQEMKKQEQRRLQQLKQEEIKQRQQEERVKQQKQRTIKLEKEKQLQKQKQNQRQSQQQRSRVENDRIQKQRQMHERQRKRFEQIEQAKRQKQRLKLMYSKQRQNIKSAHQSPEKNSLIYELQSNQINNSRQQEQQKIVSLDRMPSTYSRQHSSNGSQRSNNSKKARKNKQSVIPVQQKKKIYSQMSPRAEASFYQQNKPEPRLQPLELEKLNQTNQIPRKLMSFNQQQDLNYDPKPQYKTDSYFYDKSLKAPSSKPPISKKSSVSRSKSKQGLIEKKNPKISQIKVKTNDGGNGEKKMSLIQLAMRKNYQPNSGSECQSQDSFRSRQNSIQSNDSKRSNSHSANSRKSRKKQSVIRLKQNAVQNYNRPPSYRKISPENKSLTRRTSEHQIQMYHHQSEDYEQQERQRRQVQNKPRIIKGCSFIDQNGRLVQKGDMIVKGNQVTGTRDAVGFNQKKLFQRLMNSRQKRRSRSRQRSLNRSRASSRSIEKVGSKHSNSNYREFAESQAYSQAEQGRQTGYRYQSSGQNFYRNDQSQYNNYMGTGSRSNFNTGSNYRTTPPTNLQQFMKPIEEAGIHSRNKMHNEPTLRKQTSQKKRSMQRTQKGSRGGYY